MLALKVTVLSKALVLVTPASIRHHYSQNRLSESGSHAVYALTAGKRLPERHRKAPAPPLRTLFEMEISEQTSTFDSDGDEADYSFEEQLDCLIDILRALAKSANRPIFDKLVKSVVREWKRTPSPEPEEGVNNAWEFLGLINYHGGDHGLYDFTISELEDAVQRAIRCLPTYEQCLLNLANGSDCFDWDDFKRGFTSSAPDEVLKYLCEGEPLDEAAKAIADAIRSQAPNYDPYA